MKEWIGSSEGLKRPGLRLALVRAGVPSPWSELCRAVFYVKQVDYAQLDGESYRTLRGALWRPLYTWQPTMTSAQAVDALIQRRDRVYAAHFPLPVVMT